LQLMLFSKTNTSIYRKSMLDGSSILL
jgi:hypothetical protein